MGGRGASSGLKRTMNAMNAFNSLSNDDKEALTFYTADGYGINYDLAQGNELNRGYSELQKDLDKAISKGELQKDTDVFRGINVAELGIKPRYPEYDYENFKKDIVNQINEKAGKKITYKGYMSTSIDINNAKGFTNKSNDQGALVKAKAKKGTNAIYIGKNGGVGDEKEMLFGRNKTYTVKGAYLDNGKIVIEADIS